MKTLILLLLLPGTICPVVFGQMPAEQYVLWKVWSADSLALRNQGYGDYIFTDRDTIILEGSDTDSVVFEIGNARGYFNIWIIPDTANFSTSRGDFDHELGETDSLSVSFRPGLSADMIASNPIIELSYIDHLDWNAENAYYEYITPPLSRYLEFYISHTGVSDTSAIIIEIQWQ